MVFISVSRELRKSIWSTSKEGGQNFQHFFENPSTPREIPRSAPGYKVGTFFY